MNATTHRDKAGTHGIYGPALGGALGLLFGVAVFVITKNVMIALICSVPLGVTLGVALTERGGSAPSSRKTRVLLWSTFVVGVVVLLVLGLLAG